MNIVTRAQWGAHPWRQSVPAVSFSQRTEFFVHYDGGTPVVITGASVPRRIESIHLGNGWSGIGYNFVVDQAGNIFEGRGWRLAGAHCPNHNVSGFGVQIAIGGSQAPSPQALAACRALYDEACRLTGRGLAKKGHRDGFPTECPGATLYAWVKAGMPSPKAVTTQEDDMGVYVEPEGTQPGDGVYWVDGTGVYGVTRARWNVLTAHGGARAVTISRADYLSLLSQMPKPTA